MERIGHVCQEVRERFTFYYCEFAFFQGTQVITDRPNLQAGAQIIRILESGNKLQLPVMVEIHNGITPFIFPVFLNEFLQFGIDQDDLRVNIRRIRISSKCRRCCKSSCCKQ